MVPNQHHQEGKFVLFPKLSWDDPLIYIFCRPLPPPPDNNFAASRSQQNQQPQRNSQHQFKPMVCFLFFRFVVYTCRFFSFLSKFLFSFLNMILIICYKHLVIYYAVEHFLFESFFNSLSSNFYGFFHI